jgi:DNA modification methylase
MSSPKRGCFVSDLAKRLSKVNIKIRTSGHVNRSKRLLMQIEITTVKIDIQKLEPNGFSTGHYDYKSRRRKNFCKNEEILKPIEVTLIKEKYIILNGIRRYYEYLRSGVKDVHCVVLHVPESEIEAYVLKANASRIKSMYEQCTEAMRCIPPIAQGKNLGGNTRYDLAIAKANVEVSGSTLKRFCALHELDKKYKDAHDIDLGLVDDVRKGVPINVVLKKAKEKADALKLNGEVQGEPPYRVAASEHFTVKNYSIFHQENDDLSILKSLEGYKGIDLGFMSPYYLNQRTYDKKNEKGHESHYNEYLEDLKPTFREFYKELKETGVLAVNLGDTYGRYDNNQILHRFSIMMTDELGYHFFFKQIWHKRNVLTKGREDKLPIYNYEEILYFCKDPSKCKFKPFSFYPVNKKIEFIQVGGRRNADGTNTKEKWALSKPYQRFHQFIDTQEFEVIHTAAAGSDSRLLKKYCEEGHPAVMPLEVPLYGILSSTAPGDLVVDCYAGSGTTLATGLLLGRRVVGIERKMKFVQLADKRLSDLCSEIKLEEEKTQKHAELIELDFSEKFLKKAG